MRHRFFSPKIAILLLLLLSALIWKFAPATAAGTVGDGTPASCTEDALITALQGGGAVTFDCGQSADAPVTIPITQRIALTANTVIDGGATQALILNGGDAGTGDRNGVGIFSVAADVTVEIRNLTILNAGDSAIVSQGALTLDSVVIQEARAAQCAGVQSTGTLTVRRGMLTTNTAESIGGNACVLAGTATFENADVRFGRAERGGGLYVGGGSVNLIDSYIAYNLSMGQGAGIYVDPAATVTLRGVGLVNNVADPASPDALGGGIYNAGTSTIIGAVIVDNEALRGGGVHNVGDLIVRESDATGNFAGDNGGGLWNGTQATWSTSSLARNTATGSGGGFYTTGDLTVLNSTLAENSGTSFNQVDGGAVTIHYSTLNESAAALTVAAGTVNVRGSIVTGCTGAVTLTFNRTLDVARVVLADGTAQPISAEIVTTGGNRLTTNDTATVEIGALPSPSVTGVGPTQLYENALAITYAAPSVPGVAGYRILRRDEGSSWTLVGESVALVHYDTQLAPRTRYCYAVQAYDAAGLLSAQSEEVCNTAVQTKWQVHLPMVKR